MSRWIDCLTPRRVLGWLIPLTMTIGVAHAQAPDDPRWEPPPEMGVLTQLAGNWQVTIDLELTPGREPVRVATTSEIRSLFQGAFIQQELEIPLPAGRPGLMRVVAGFDKFRRVYRLNVLSDLDALSDVYEGVLTADGRLVLSDVPTGTSTYYPDKPTRPVYSRLIFSSLTPQSFVIDNAVSTDAGGSWRDYIRLTFTRQAKPGPAPCTDPRYRALDFWLGDWIVTTEQGVQAGRSSVSSILGGCVIFEQWDDVRGESGRGVHRFDAALGHWVQTWVDNRGRSMELSGEIGDRSINWLRTEPGGGLERGEVRALSEDRLEQQGQRSVDQGKTWTPLFHLIYSRAPTGVDPQLLAVRDRVWRAWFAGDEAYLSEVLPPEFLGINPGDEPATGLPETIAEAKQFAASGGRLVRVSFDDARSQRYGDVSVLFSRYELVLEVAGKETTSRGWVTEIFVLRDGRWMHPAWHMDVR